MFVIVDDFSFCLRISGYEQFCLICSEEITTESLGIKLLVIFSKENAYVGIASTFQVIESFFNNWLGRRLNIYLY